MPIDGYTCALDVLAAMPASVRSLVAALPPDLRTWQPAAEQWSIRDVLAHLLEADVAVTRPRIEQMIHEDHPLLTIAPLTTPAGDAEQVLARWAGARTANVAFFRALTAEQVRRTGRHPRHGIFSVRDLVIELAYHDQDHLHQIVTLVQAALYPDMQRFADLYPRPT